MRWIYRETGPKSPSSMVRSSANSPPAWLRSAVASPVRMLWISTWEESSWSLELYSFSSAWIQASWVHSLIVIELLLCWWIFWSEFWHTQIADTCKSSWCVVLWPKGFVEMKLWPTDWDDDETPYPNPNLWVSCLIARTIPLVVSCWRVFFLLALVLVPKTIVVLVWVKYHDKQRSKHLIDALNTYLNIGSYTKC